MDKISLITLLDNSLHLLYNQVDFMAEVDFIMDFPYTIEDLSSRCKVSKQSIYSLIKKNQEFVKKNSTRKGKKVKYNQEVLNLFLDYYGVNEAEDPSQKDPEKAIEAEKDPQKAEDQSATSPQEKDPEGKIKALESEIEALKRELAAAREQNTELIRQNGQVLLLLQEEKQEKMKLLPAPKQGIIKKIGNFFKNKD